MIYTHTSYLIMSGGKGIIHLLSGDKESKGGGEYNEHISGRTKAQTFWRGGKGGCEYDEQP